MPNGNSNLVRMSPPSDLRARMLRLGVLEFLILEWSRPSRVPISPLTSAEREVMEFLLSGCSNSAIAGFRKTSVATVAKQVVRVFEKLGVRSRPEFFATMARGAPCCDVG